MRIFRAEFHVHTVLSPCAEVEMIPPLIVQEAQERGIGLIAITDHNASANIEAVQKAAAGSDLVVLPGMEVQTSEEVHVLCLFDDLERLASWQERVDACLPALQNNPDYFGEQFVVDETGDFVRREERLLLCSTNLSIDQVVDEVQALGGLAIPAHVDRKAFGLIANLGFVPPHPDLAALEVSRHVRIDTVRQTLPQVGTYPLIQSGDVHRLEEFLGANIIQVDRPSIAEIRLALLNQDGRSHHLRKSRSSP